MRVPADEMAQQTVERHERVLTILASGQPPSRAEIPVLGQRARHQFRRAESELCLASQ